MTETVDRVDYPFVIAVNRVEDKTKGTSLEDAEYCSVVQLTDKDIVAFSNEMINVLGRESRNYRWLRKISKLWGAGKPAKAKQHGIKLIREALSSYYLLISKGHNEGNINNTRITHAGAQLYKQVLAALIVVGDAISNQVPSLR